MLQQFYHAYLWVSQKNSDRMTKQDEVVCCGPSGAQFAEILSTSFPSLILNYMLISGHVQNIWSLEYGVENLAFPFHLLRGWDGPVVKLHISGCFCTTFLSIGWHTRKTREAEQRRPFFFIKRIVRFLERSIKHAAFPFHSDVCLVQLGKMTKRND